MRAASSPRHAAFRNTGTTTLTFGASVAGMNVDNVHKWFVGCVAADVLDEQGLPPERRLLTAACNVRCQEQIRRSPGWMVRRHRFVADDVKPGSREAAAAQRSEESGLVQGLCAADVHDEGAARQRR